MELMDGITLKQYMEKRGQLNWREALHFITQIMRGLSHAHSRGIVHRDIKPQNIMVLRDGSVKVADFGIACLENSTQTLTQEALGSVHYISPEQARGDRTDARSDIYSAGVVLYEMLTGRLPFEGDSAVSVAIQHLSSIPLAPREINRDIPEQMELICMKAMTSDLNHRYTSADAMIADLEAFRKNPDVNLDFDLADLQPEEVDEPTRPLRTAAVHAAVNSQPPRRAQQPAYERERRRDYDDEAPARRSNVGRGILIVVAGILALALVFVLFRTIFSSFEKQEAPEQYVVPSVIGETLASAGEMPEIKDIFKLVENETPYYSEEYAPGQIAKQSPEAGSTRKGDNLVIEVWISAGEETGVMPDVTNMVLAQANLELKSLIKKYELTVEAPEESRQFSDEITEGYIISSIPAEGEPLAKGDTVHLVVSKGPELKEFAMPNFVGQSIDKVQEQLKTTWKLTCNPVDIEMVNSNKPGGQIIWQSIPETTMVKEWDTVKFQVSSGLSAATRQENYDLPQDGRETVLVEVFVGDELEPQYSERLYCSDGTAKVPLTGTGTKLVKVYFDGILDQNLVYYLQFD